MKLLGGRVKTPLYAKGHNHKQLVLPNRQAPGRAVPSVTRQARQSQRFTVQPLAHVAPQYSVPDRKLDRQAILLQRFRGHNSTVTSIVVTSDTENAKEIVTASLDKSVAVWELPVTLNDPAKIKEKARVVPEGGPVFSLVEEPPSYESPRRQLFCGVAAKSVMTWDMRSSSLDKRVKLNGHTGWVRALATNRRWLFSAGCNKIAQWDLSRSVPRKFNELTLFTGDIQGLEYGDGKLFSCGADGSIRSWTVGKKGELEVLAAREKAHQDRVSDIIYKKGFLYSVSLDGSVKMWDAQSLELVEAVYGAHNGGKVHCLAAGADGNLYTGGEDKLIRRWQLGSLDVAGGGVLYGHHYAVRSISAGQLETLVSADSAGEVAVWKI